MKQDFIEDKEETQVQFHYTINDSELLNTILDTVSMSALEIICHKPTLEVRKATSLWM